MKALAPRPETFVAENVPAGGHEGHFGIHMSLPGFVGPVSSLADAAGDAGVAAWVICCLDSTLDGFDVSCHAALLDLCDFSEVESADRLG